MSVNPEAVKRRVFDRVANRPHIPTETVEIQPGEQVAPVGTVIVPMADAGPYLPHRCEGISGRFRKYLADAATPAPTADETYIESKPVPTAADLGAMEYALANEQVLSTIPETAADEVLSTIAPQFATGGIVEPQESYIVGEQVCEYPMPHWRYPAATEGEPDDVPVVDNTFDNVGETFNFAPRHKPLFTRQAVGRGNRVVEEAPKPTEYEQAAELGLSVHALRYINKELASIRTQIKTLCRQGDL